MARGMTDLVSEGVKGSTLDYLVGFLLSNFQVELRSLEGDIGQEKEMLHLVFLGLQKITHWWL